VRLFFFSIFFSSISILAFAQQPAQYSLYQFNRFAFNPAYAGMDNSLSATGVFRKQWVDLAGSPTSQHLNVHAPLPFLSSGVGLSFQNDELGPMQFQSLQLAYSYQLPIGRSGTLSVGASGVWRQSGLDGSVIRTPDGNYTDNNFPVHNDDLLPINPVNTSAIDATAGIYYQSEVFDVGISAINLLDQPLEFATLSIQPERAYFFTAGAHFDVGRIWSLHPSVLVKSDVVQTQTDISVLLRYDDNISLGGSFRGYDSNSIDALAILGGLRINEKLRLYYSYDVPLSELNTVQTGSHEILLNYNLNKDFGKGVPPPIIYSPRNL
jgi:type IX secretion system PorP/SprF family membrane protein